MIDLFDIHSQEQRYSNDLRRDIERIEIGLRASLELASLIGQPAFQHFIKSVSALEQDTIRGMRDLDGSNDHLRTLQGRLQAFRMVIDLCSNSAENAKRLAQRLKTLQDLEQQTVLPDGRVLPQGIGSWPATTVEPEPPR